MLQVYCLKDQPSFQFTTVNNAVTAWDVAIDVSTPGTAYPINIAFSLNAAAGDSFLEASNRQCNDLGCTAPIVFASATGAPGSWVDPPISVPEIEAKGAVGTFLLLAMGLAIVRGREQR